MNMQSNVGRSAGTQAIRALARRGLSLYSKRLSTMPTLAMLALLYLAIPARAAVAQDGPSMVILVRHAEKSTVPGNDPPLSEAGIARAKALASALANVPITTVITTTFKRTAETAADVAEARHLTPQKIAIDGPTAAHVAAVAAAVRASKGVVLVIGHSNTIPAIVTALGGPKLPDICDSSYSTMFVMQPSGAAPSVAIVRYGATDPEPAASCATMQAR